MSPDSSADVAEQRHGDRSQHEEGENECKKIAERERHVEKEKSVPSVREIKSVGPLPALV